MDSKTRSSIFSGIAFRQTQYAVLAAFIIGVLLSVLQIYLDFNQHSEHFDNEILQVIEITKSSASRAAYVLDADAAADVVDGLFQFGAISEVQILTDTDELLINKTKTAPTYRYGWFLRIIFGEDRRYYTSLTMLDEPAREIGKMIVFTDVNRMAEGFIERSAVVLVSGIVRNLFLAFVLSIIFFFFLSKPLVRIIQTISKIDPESPDIKLIDFPKGHKNDELNILVDTVNRLLKSSNRYLIALTQSKQELEEQVDIRTQELRENEDRLTKAQQISNTGHWIWILETNRLQLSNEACRILGLDVQTNKVITYESLFEFIHPDDRTLISDSLDKALTSDNTYRAEYRIVLPENKEKVIHELAEIVRTPEGNPVKIIGTIQDITQRKQAEQLATRFGRIVEGSLNEIFIFDATTLKFILVNEGARTNLGYSLDELKHMTPVDIKPDFTLEIFQNQIQTLYQDNTEIIVFETRHERKNGSTYDVEIHLQLSKIEVPPVFIASVQDITERKKADEYRRINEHRLSMLLDLNRVASKLDEKELCTRALDIAVEVTGSKIGYLHMINEDQETIQLVTWNAAALKLCTAVHATHYPISEAGIWADSFRLKQTVVHNDYPNEPNKKGYPEGHFQVLRHMSAPVMEAGRVYMIVGVGNKNQPYTDSDIKQLELVAEEIHKFIMRRRAEEALKEARIQAEAANLAKSEFLAIMSHEIRTPLNVLLGMSDILQESSLTDEQSTQLALVHKAGNHLLNLINDILDLSKIEVGAVVLEIAPFQIKELFSTVSHMMKPRAEDKGLSFAIDIPPDLPSWILGDEGRLRQILINLLGNAIKFTDQGQIVLSVTYVSQGSLFQISITDTGVGIAPEHLEHVFAKFTQADASISRRYGGTGLGLAISNNLVRMMGGTILVESHVNKGSSFKFTISLPTIESPVSKVNDQNLAVSSEPYSPLTILLVEDSPDNQLLIQAYLKKTPWQIITAVNGLEAVTKVKDNEKFDLVLMDIQMPIMDGYTATREIRAWEKLQNQSPLPILALSAHALKSEKMKSLEAGCDRHLVKPIKKKDLINAIQQMVSSFHQI
ncbi:MAG: PAS domain S-box protein [Magnetococcales bacterium]|nr:PAS domain S-box protein [Magnetococcales bacterium]